MFDDADDVPPEIRRDEMRLETTETCDARAGQPQQPPGPPLGEGFGCNRIFEPAISGARSIQRIAGIDTPKRGLVDMKPARIRSCEMGIRIDASDNNVRKKAKMTLPAEAGQVRINVIGKRRRPRLEKGGVNQIVVGS
ncbi:MAG: hypothetical protein WBD53_06015 [Xanthobacteraceae bacterium]